MSEPMSNHEIEDVLSSIRRLVSEDLRPAPKPSNGAPAVTGKAPAEKLVLTNDKLLLTPALRVVTEPEPPAPAKNEAAAPTAVEDVVARLGAAVAEEDWESPFGDPEVWPGAEVKDEVPTFVHRARDVAGTFADDVIEAPMVSFVEDDEDVVRPEPEPAAAALREVVPPQDDPSWADQAEAEVIADLASAAEDEVISNLYEEPQAMTFDEEVLRDLVRDLIREELSGALGERITRNVRKLVRAEIARALALRDFG
jgi:hypothetical protein